MFLADLAPYVAPSASSTNDVPFWQVTVFIMLPALIALIWGGKKIYPRLWLRRIASRPLQPLAQTEDSDVGSMIMAFFAKGHDLQPAAKGVVNNMKYHTFITVPHPMTWLPDTNYRRVADQDAFVIPPSLLCWIDLPFNTSTHLVGFSQIYKKSLSQFPAFMEYNNLQKIVLEGDFTDYFDIYAEPGQDVNVRYVLTPAAMEFVEDFCRNHFWEVCNSQLYFAVPDPDADQQRLLAEAASFIEHIKPALLPGQPGAAPVHRESSYGEYDGPALPCPLCAKTMEENEDWQICPDGHGILVSGRNLLRLHNKELQPPAMTGNVLPHTALTCPNCHHEMVVDSYLGSNIKINACTNCIFRWLDSDDVVAIANLKTVGDGESEQEEYIYWV